VREGGLAASRGVPRRRPATAGGREKTRSRQGVREGRLTANKGVLKEDLQPVEACRSEDPQLMRAGQKRGAQPGRRG